MDHESGFEKEELPTGETVHHVWGEISSPELQQHLDEVFGEYHKAIDQAKEAAKRGDVLTFLSILDSLRASIDMTVQCNAAYMVLRNEAIRRQAELN